MPVNKVEYNEYICDRCQSTSRSEFQRGGYCYVTLNIGSITYLGDHVGKIGKYLCGACSSLIQKWLNEKVPDPYGEDE